MIPSLRQFSRWSLPAKASYFGAFLGIVGIFLAIALYVVTLRQETSFFVFEPGLPVSSKPGECWTQSFASTRANAWRCGADGIYDPCFQLARLDSSDNPPVIVCGARPGDETDAFAVTLTSALPAASDDRKILGEESPESAWLLKLEDGSLCAFSSGASATIANDRINYFCDQAPDGTQLVLVGSPKPGEVWLAKGLMMREDAIVSEALYNVFEVYW